MRKGFELLASFLFGCHHTDLSRAFTLQGRTYRVCLQCGKEFDYSLETMSFCPEGGCHQHPASLPVPAPSISRAA
jgi:hypothetical protein